MLDPFRAVKHARRMVALSMCFMAFAAGFLVWSGTALISVGIMEPGYASLGLGAFAILIASLMQPKHHYKFG